MQSSLSVGLHLTLALAVYACAVAVGTDGVLHGDGDRNTMWSVHSLKHANVLVLANR